MAQKQPHNTILATGKRQERRSKTIQYFFDITSFPLDTYVTNEIRSIVN